MRGLAFGFYVCGQCSNARPCVWFLHLWLMLQCEALRLVFTFVANAPMRGLAFGFYVCGQCFIMGTLYSIGVFVYPFGG